MVKTNSTKQQKSSQKIIKEQFAELTGPFCTLENIGEVLRQGGRQTFTPETLEECVVALSTTTLHALSEIKVEGAAKRHSVAAVGLLRQIIEAGHLFPSGELLTKVPREYVAIGAAIERLTQLLAIELDQMGAAVGLTPVEFWVGDCPEDKKAA